MPDFFSLGELQPDQDPAHLISAAGRAMLPLCQSNPGFVLQELRRHELPNVGLCDVLVVDCINDQVPSRNQVGIKVRERLALVFPSDPQHPPQVRALRTDFPILPHLNHVDEGEPNSLCLYFESWSAVQRTWTPQKYLQRVLWWLSESAKGLLHRPDQPVERVYFDSPMDVVLPPEFDATVKHEDRALILTYIEREGHHRTFRADFRPKADLAKPGVGETVPLVAALDPVLHGGVERYPATLGALQEQLVARGSSLIGPLRETLRRQISDRGVVPVRSQTCLLILQLPVKRTESSAPENQEDRGFIILHDLVTVGLAAGVLSELGGRYYSVPLLRGATSIERTTWRDIKVSPVDVKRALSREMARRASGISEANADGRRVLAGLGALGSSLADIWSREAWGEWTLVDHDYVQPHNTARHAAKDFYVGGYKADVVKQLVDLNYQEGYYSALAIHNSVVQPNVPTLDEAIRNAVLLVDATTTLEVPRDLAQRDDRCRLVSVFLVPSGCASVLVLEDAERELRLDCLEPQYYHTILNNNWGDTHLAGNNGHFWVGAGCRDVSTVLSNEMVQLHSAILSRQVRLLSGQAEAQIRVWIADAVVGNVAAISVPIRRVRVISSGDWRVISNDGVESKLIALRHEHLPNETGGVILGYVDQKLKKIFVVDVLPAPPDSDGTKHGFTRGIEGLGRQIDEVKRRTAHIVGYIGEWHSHPPFHSPNPSREDRVLMAHLASVLARDGEPALMIIAGSANQLSYELRGEVPSAALEHPQ